MPRKKQTPTTDEGTETPEPAPKPKKEHHRGHNEGSIYQRASDGLWVASVSLGVDPQTGKTKRKPLYGKTRAEVKDKLIKALADKQRGINIAPERQTVAKFLTFWLQSVKGQVRATTYAKYEMHVRLRLIPKLGRYQLDKLAPQHVQAMVNALNDGSIAPSTVGDALTVLIIALNQGIVWEMVVRNVAAHIEKPRQPQKQLRVLTVDEARRLLAAVRGERLEALFVVSLSLGLRRGEALGLRWVDVDLDRGRLTVQRGLQRVDHELRFIEPKSDSANRTISLPAETVNALREHRRRQEEERKLAGAEWQDQGLVFPAAHARGNAGGGPFDPRNYKRFLDRMLIRAGLDPMRVHDLRHSCASLLLAQGVDMKLVSELLGHSRVGITLDTYSHLYDSSRQEAANKMDFILRGAPETDEDSEEEAAESRDETE